MKIEKISEPYLFEKHSRAVIKQWNRKLKYGFYKRAWGGHANDGDAFGIWLKYDTKNELFTILNELQIKLTFSGQKDGNNYEVSEIDFENCLRIENIILNKNLGNYISSEYQNYATNISKRIYPELFD